MAGDASYASVALLLHGDGANTAVVFTDNSPSPKTATPVGNAQISTAQSKFGGASMLFGGSADALSFAHAAELNLASGDFTIEAWIYVTSLVTARTICQKDQSFGTTFPSYNFGVNANGSIQGGVGTGASAGYSQNITSAVSLIAVNTMYHVAFTRSGTTLRLFIDGAQVQSGTQTGTPTDGGKVLLVGRYPSGGGAADAWMAGNIDDLRITKGVARYTANFTPHTTPHPDNLGEVSGTVVDSASAACARLIRAYRRDTGAFVKEVYSGPGDASYNSVVLSLHGDVNATGAFTDSSRVPKTMTVVGATISTAQAKYGLGSMLFNGSSQYAHTPAVADFLLGAGDFTAEAWIRLGAVGASQKIMGVWSDTSAVGFSWKVEVINTNYLQFTYSTTGGNFFNLAATSSPFVTNTWYHIEVVRSSTNIYLFVNGVLLNTLAVAAASFYAVASSKLFEVGRDGAGPAAYFNGYISDLRLTKGVARHTATFTPPTDRHPDKVSGAMGSYSFYTPTLDELDIICFDNTDGTLENDRVLRTIPA